MRYFSDAPVGLSIASTEYNNIEEYKGIPIGFPDGSLANNPVFSIGTVSSNTLIDLGADIAGVYFCLCIGCSGRCTFELIIRDNALNDLAIFYFSIGTFSFRMFVDSESVTWRYVLLNTLQIQSGISGHTNAGTTLLLPI